MSFFAEIKRRKIAQVAAVYLVVAWLTLQVVDVIATPLRLPEWFPTVVIVLLGVGLPIALIISWAFNVTPTGVVRETEAAQSSSGRTIEFVLIGLVAVAVLWLLYRTEFSETLPPETQAVAEVTVPDVLANSIAVLPFANLSPDPDNAFFAAGIHDSILNELAKISDMRVISRTTMIRYADTEKSMPEIAKELRVETIMEGSIQYANGRVLVTAQLIDPQTDTHLWSENYNEDFADIFGIQADIATRIAEELQAQVSPQEQEGLRAQMTTSTEAYAYYLQAMESGGADLSPRDDHPEFHELLDKAIAADPSFARAYAIKARLYASRATGDALATEHANKALELDPNLALAHYATAYNHGQRMRDEEAHRHFARALELGPNDPNIMDDAARYYAGMGEFDTALSLAARVHDIDPGFSSVLGVVSSAAGDYDAAARAHRQQLQFRSGNYRQRLRLAITEHLRGNEAAAQGEARVALNLMRSESTNDALTFDIARHAYQLRILGFQPEARQFFDLFVERAANRDEPSLTASAMAYAAVGDEQKVMEYLQLVAQQVENGYRSGANLHLAINEMNDPMLETPEFIEIRNRLGYDLSKFQ